MIGLKDLIAEGKRLKSIRVINDDVLQKLAAVAQKQYDRWQQNEEGYDEEVGSGGICHLIAWDLAGIFSELGIECSSVCSSFEQHVYLVCQFAEGIYEIDIPYRVYETGGGFTWKKLPDVKFDKSHVTITKIDNDPKKFSRYIDEL